MSLFGKPTGPGQAEVLPLGCSDEYTDDEGRVRGMCHTLESCEQTPVAAGALVESLRCSCLDPAYTNPDMAAGDAPYEVNDGCLIPKRMDSLSRYLANSNVHVAQAV